MSRSEGTLNIYYGLLHSSISEQIKEEGFPLPDNIDYLDNCFNALKQLKFLITDSMYSQICKRLNKEVNKAVQKKVDEENGES